MFEQIIGYVIPLLALLLVYEFIQYVAKKSKEAAQSYYRYPKFCGFMLFDDKVVSDNQYYGEKILENCAQEYKSSFRWPKILGILFICCIIFFALILYKENNLYGFGTLVIFTSCFTLLPALLIILINIKKNRVSDKIEQSNLQLYFVEREILGMNKTESDRGYVMYILRLTDGCIGLPEEVYTEFLKNKYKNVRIYFYEYILDKNGFVEVEGV